MVLLEVVVGEVAEDEVGGCSDLAHFLTFYVNNWTSRCSTKSISSPSVCRMTELRSITYRSGTLRASRLAGLVRTGAFAAVSLLCRGVVIEQTFWVVRHSAFSAVSQSAFADTVSQLPISLYRTLESRHGPICGAKLCGPATRMRTAAAAKNPQCSATHPCVASQNPRK